MDQALADYYGSLGTEDGEPVADRDAFGEELARGAAGQAAELDAIISRHSQHWRIERMPVVDRNILRLASFEMKNLSTPSAVVIDQALELARRFAGDDSIAFLNGVLDAINHELRPA
jgi:N utilization substance protein B